MSSSKTKVGGASAAGAATPAASSAAAAAAAAASASNAKKNVVYVVNVESYPDIIHIHELTDAIMTNDNDRDRFKENIKKRIPSYAYQAWLTFFKKWEDVSVHYSRYSKEWETLKTKINSPKPLPNTKSILAQKHEGEPLYLLLFMFYSIGIVEQYVKRSIFFAPDINCFQQTFHVCLTPKQIRILSESAYQTTEAPIHAIDCVSSLSYAMNVKKKNFDSLQKKHKVIYKQIVTDAEWKKKERMPSDLATIMHESHENILRELDLKQREYISTMNVVDISQFHSFINTIYSKSTSAESLDDTGDAIFEFASHLQAKIFNDVVKNVPEKTAFDKTNLHRILGIDSSWMQIDEVKKELYDAGTKKMSENWGKLTEFVVGAVLKQAPTVYTTIQFNLANAINMFGYRVPVWGNVKFIPVYQVAIDITLHQDDKRTPSQKEKIFQDAYDKQINDGLIEEVDILSRYQIVDTCVTGWMYVYILFFFFQVNNLPSNIDSIVKLRFMVEHNVIPLLKEGMFRTYVEKLFDYEINVFFKVSADDATPANDHIAVPAVFQSCIQLYPGKDVVDIGRQNTEVWTRKMLLLLKVRSLVSMLTWVSKLESTDRNLRTEADTIKSDMQKICEKIHLKFGHLEAEEKTEFAILSCLGEIYIDDTSADHQNIPKLPPIVSRTISEKGKNFFKTALEKIFWQNHYKSLSSSSSSSSSLSLA